MMSKNARNHTLEMSKWVADLKYEDIPKRIIDLARLQIMSVIASVMASYRTTAGRSIIDTFTKRPDSGPCRLFPSGDSLSLSDCVSALSSLSMLLDYDDYLFAGHTGHSSVLVPLVMSEKENVSGKKFITAQVAANEIEARVGASVMIGPLNGQMWAFIHAAGAACATGSIYSLSDKQMANALGMSLSQPNRPLNTGFLGGHSKLFTAQSGIHTGINSARLAECDLEGPSDILEADDGFCRTFSFVPLFPMLTQLGECWLTDTLSFKIYPGCAYISPIIDGVFEIMSQKKPDISEIFKIDIFASILTVKMDELSRPLVRGRFTHPITLNFHTPYNVAAALIDGDLGPAQFEQDHIADDKYWELAKKVRINHDISLTGKCIDSVTDLIDIRYLLGELRFGSIRNVASTLGPASPLVWLSSGKEIINFVDESRRTFEKIFGVNSNPDKSHLSDSAEDFNMSFGARVIFEMKNDKVAYEFEQPVSFGAAGRPFDEKKNHVFSKFRKECSKVIGDGPTEEALSMISDFENYDNSGIRDLIGILCLK